ncbi:Lipase (class 3) [Malonomonas rubra DSM 5091]|uniref:Lipase (Class 3) n=1 Tax=Malonomonas rubra DSM 5091 TaxID=1122189 RepID=A0A1M6B766_MALRU|nr:lipase family protein [Malonomonas rubra]SHI44530.1 Lipase (class 3) [Malonomonas rubra DSM 5091]
MGDNTYFVDQKLLSPPIKRAAYSDRMAYVLGEMSGLAYFPFEGVDGLLSEAAIEAAKIVTNKSDESLERFLADFAEKLYHNKGANLTAFKEILKIAGFQYIAHFDRATSQGFLCKRISPGTDPYLVLAFRGTEKKINDWLTDADAVPKQKDGYRVHNGFYKAFDLIKDDIRSALKKKACLDADGNLLPLFITGHSLGGALALLATKYLARNIDGACYTYGAPRVGDYEFFFDIKTPVYRVVNSSDIVPRVPLGAANQLAIRLVKGLAWVFDSIAPLKSLFRWLEQELDKLNGYRHYGDLRYLTDVQGGRFHEARLVLNPPGLDRMQWFWKHLKASIFTPVKSHSSLLYRKKLVEVANARREI